MRKFVSGLLVLILLFSICGCATDSSSEQTLNMTIIESRGERAPKVFESDCFYAYDSEHNFYRVKYSKFKAILKGLEEGDEIIVTYSGKYKSLDTMIFGGYTPKYEIQAIRVSKD